MSGTRYFDIETASGDDLFHRSDFVRLCGAAADGEVGVTTDPGQLIGYLGRADEIVGHNIMGFDLLALAYHHGADWTALAGRARDTEILARLANPPRARDTGGSIDRYGLDEIAQQLGVTGKITGEGGLRALKNEFGGYDMIPTDDARYVAYLRADVRATRAVAAHYPMTEYGAREHRLAMLAGQMTLNGFRVDQELLAVRIAEGEARKAAALEALSTRFGLPLGRSVVRGRGAAKAPVWEPFSSPQATKEGAAWLADVWERYGVRRPPLTDGGKSGVRQLSTAAEALKVISGHPRCPAELRELLDLLAVVTTTRTVYQTASNHLAGDRVHAKISMRQASGRWSVTAPGLTVFGKRGGRHREREIFLPEPGHVLLSCDLSQVDMRGVAAHCQDPAYMAMFEPGRDVHTELAVQIFGDASYRERAKPLGHGANYGMGRKRMIADGHEPALVNAFFDGMARMFPRKTAWTQEVRDTGERGELLDNGFGRKMRCEPERAYTQAPALMGQGTARDLMCDALLRIPQELWSSLRAQVHDEVIMSVPQGDAEDVRAMLKEAFTTEWRGVPILCDVSKPGATWGEISAK
jgi:DNA polymerase-1